MPAIGRPHGATGGEAAGVLASLAFMGLASVRDVYFGAPIYVNQIGTALASPLTVRAVLALGPVVIFLLQVVEGRLSPSPYSLACALLYGCFAVSAALARRSSMRSVSMSLRTARGSRKVEV